MIVFSLINIFHLASIIWVFLQNIGNAMIYPPVRNYSFIAKVTNYSKISEMLMRKSLLKVFSTWYFHTILTKVLSFPTKYLIYWVYPHYKHFVVHLISVSVTNYRKITEIIWVYPRMNWKFRNKYETFAVRNIVYILMFRSLIWQWILSI